MATKKGGKCKRIYYRAKLVTNVETCVFCLRAVDDEIIYGKLYAIGDIQCHYFCALLSCCLIQKGTDEEGLFGFLYPDILAEVERSKKHRCSYCNRDGANLGCSVTQCRKQFHLPCGRERDAVSLFYGNYKSFCAKHAPKQKIVESLMPNVKMRIAKQRRQKQTKYPNVKSEKTTDSDIGDTQVAETVCVICYEPVEGFPSPRTFWPPCCARDAWFHRSCLQRMALSAGMHYLKCPLCNDKDDFYKAVASQGYYVPDRDAAWELEQNAFAEIYERPVSCGADTCNCPAGRDHDSDTGPWDIKLCILCGSTAVHVGCTDSIQENTNIYICNTCKPAAPGDLEKLIASIEKVQLEEQAAETVRYGPVMPSRMSLRRTKPFTNSGPCSSRVLSENQCLPSTPDNVKTKTEVSRLELNLKKPVRRIFEPAMKNIDNILLSPIKMLEQGFSEKMGQLHSELVVDSSKVLEKLREKLRKPRPLVAKKRIINNILDEIFSPLHDVKHKETLKEWNSPKKTCNMKVEDCKETIDNVTPTTNNIGEHPVCNREITLKYKPVKEISMQFIEKPIHKEEFGKNCDFRCNFNHKHIEMKSDVSNLRTAIDFANEVYKSQKNLKRKLPHEDPVSKKKPKFNCSLKRKQLKNSNKKKLDVHNKPTDYKELLANTDLDKEQKTKECIREFKKQSFDNNNDIHKTRVADRADKKVIITIPKKKVINCSLKRKAEQNSGETKKNMEVEIKYDFIETGRDTGLENAHKIDENVADLNKSIKKSDIDERKIVDNKVKPIKIIHTIKKDMINHRLKTRVLHSSVINNTNLEIVSKSEKTFTELEKIHKSEEDLSENIKNTDTDKSKIDENKVNPNLENRKSDFDKSKATTNSEKTYDLKEEELNDTDIDLGNKISKKRITDESVKEINNRRWKSDRRKFEYSRKVKNKNIDNKRYNKETLLKGLKPENDPIGVTLDTKDKKVKLKYSNKYKKKLSIRNKNIKVKIRWKKEQLKFKITEKKQKKSKLNERTPKALTQYLLKYSPELTSPKDMMVKPDFNVTPVKKKYIKLEKHVDNMVQTNISSFFKVTPKPN